MKIEIGESLLLSWLRHVKECQLVQTNWKASNQWEIFNKSLLQQLMKISADFFQEKYGYTLYKKTTNIDQLLMQAEIDVIGMSIHNTSTEIYAIDVAFHEAGLNYGSQSETVSRVLKKYFRTAMCLHGYFKKSSGTIVFASPKVSLSVYNEIKACIQDLESILFKIGLSFNIKFLANHDFSGKILNPVLESVGDVADTAELFIRSIQLFNLFAEKERPQRRVREEKPATGQRLAALGKTDFDEMKIGVIANTILRSLLSDNTFSREETLQLQNEEYSKNIFDIYFPLLKKASSATSSRPARYYAAPVKISGEYFFICSEWYEKSRQHLVRWIEQKSRHKYDPT